MATKSLTQDERNGLAMTLPTITEWYPIGPAIDIFDFGDYI